MASVLASSPSLHAATPTPWPPAAAKKHKLGKRKKPVVTEPSAQETYSDQDPAEVSRWLKQYPVVSSMPDECARLDELSRRQQLILRHVHSQLTEREVNEVFLPILRQETGRLSLRLLEYAVTHHAKLHPVTYRLRPEDNFEFNVHENYLVQLNAYHKKLFDFFRRGPLVVLALGETVMLTTPAQINGLFWAYKHKVLEWGQMHRDELESGINREKGRVVDAPLPEQAEEAKEAAPEYRLYVKLRFCRFDEPK